MPAEDEISAARLSPVPGDRPGWTRRRGPGGTLIGSDPPQLAPAQSS